MSEDPWGDPAAVEWARHVLDNVVPQMRDSAIVLSLVTDDRSLADVKYWVELGASICMDKPILLVVLGDTVIPPKVRAVADEIVVLPGGVSPESSSDLADAIKRMMGEA